VFGYVEEVPESGFFGVVGASRVAWGGADSTVAFLDELIDGEVFFFAVAAEVPGFFVEEFGEGFGHAVAEGFDHDGGVVVALFFESFGVFFNFVAHGDSEAADVVFESGVFGGNVVGQAVMGAVLGHFALLAEEVECGQDFVSGVVDVEFDGVANCIGWPELEDCLWRKAVFLDDLSQKRLGIFVDFSGLRTVFFVFEYFGEGAFDVPGPEEGGPVNDVGNGLK